LMSARLVAPVSANPIPSSLNLATLVPRAPPFPIHLVMLREGCAGLV
jgi:hypothetical protein